MDEISTGEIVDTQSATPLIKEALERMDPDGLIEELRSDCRTFFRGLLLTLCMIGFGRIQVICTYRKLADQQVLYGRGRTAAECQKVGVARIHASPDEREVTWCLPECSKHVQRRAMDINLSGYPDDSLELLGHVARSFKCTWGGAWKGKDYGHFEI